MAAQTWRQSETGHPPRANATKGLAMTDHGASINVPAWDGKARVVGDIWRLRQDARLAICSLWTHPIGAEACVTVDGDLRRSEASRDAIALVDLELTWKGQFKEKG